MNNKIKVLHIITGLPIGEAKKVLLDLSSNLNKEIITPFVIGLNDEDVMEKVLTEYDIAIKKAEILLKEIELNYSIKSVALSHEKIYTQLAEKNI